MVALVIFSIHFVVIRVEVDTAVRSTALAQIFTLIRVVIDEETAVENIQTKVSFFVS